MTPTHPTDTTLAELIDGTLDGPAAETVRAHIAECERCQYRIGVSGPRVELPEPTGEPILFEVLAEDSDVMPAVDDVWRLAWDATTILAWVRAVTVEGVTVAPIADEDDADDRFRIAPASLSELGELAVGVSVETVVPWAVLDARVSVLPSATANPLDEWILGQRSSPRDPRIEAINELLDDLNVLATASWAPTAATENTPPIPTVDTLDLAGIPGDRQLSLVRGATPTEDEADAIESVTGGRPATQRSVDDDLRRLIDQPRFKTRIRTYAQRHQQSEAQARLRLAADAHPAQQAARSATAANVDYETVLNRLLNG